MTCVYRSIHSADKIYLTNTMESTLQTNGDIKIPFEETNGKVEMDMDNEKKKEEEMDDPWALIEPKNPGKKWTEMNCQERIQTVVWNTIKVIVLLGLIYLFICSLDFLSNAFKLLGGREAGRAFQNHDLLAYPVAGLVIGVLATVLVQSSSTSTSIVVTMVAAGLLKVRTAIFIVMGANIGTSITNTIVALGQVIDKNEFRRAFGGATVHDMFNWLSVIVLLPLEAIVGIWTDGCGPLCLLTGKIVDSFHLETNKAAKKDLLKVITKPFTNLVIQLNKGVLKGLGTLNTTEGDYSFIKHKCAGPKVLTNVTELVNKTGTVVNQTKEELVSTKVHCTFLFEHASRGTKDGGLGWSDVAVGSVLLVIALTMLCICLFCIVKLLHSMLRGRIAVIIKKVMNANFPGPLKHLTGYIVILVGAGCTILVQSSSIFTSAITPLVGIGVLSIERMYPLTLGANIGTTFTAILAALASDSSKLRNTLQVALCHLFFNIFGILIWYPIPFMRIPIPMAKKLGNTTAKYKWFALLYLLLMFFVLPAAVLGLSIAGWEYLVGIGVPIVLFIISAIIITSIQRKRPGCLPKKLRSWDFLPKALHSLEPYDRVFSKIFECCKKKLKSAEESPNKEGQDNPNFTPDFNTKL